VVGWGYGEEGKFDCNSIHLNVYIWRFLHQWWGGDMERKASLTVILYTWMSIFGDFCISGGEGEASLTVLLHIWVSIFGNFVSVVGWGKWRGKSDCNSSCQVVYILKSCKFKIYLPQIIHEGPHSPSPPPPLSSFSWRTDCRLWCMSNLITVSSCVRDISYEHLFLFLDDVEPTSTLVKKSGIALQMNWEMKWC